ncbi:hypothetical protein [Fastidiosipila sanguinis]|uniref:Uncharacterized protein n=1 Tax=Fastidiosipila sanguinis TaxID=236753 RepID=A0A2S0KPC3_9FIRM|nr:hypothetical protein [Fastidiosipila sanguinis]AVM42849.1 hypothetical protein C5Q98_06325 [Fastidiosipila sanguinis]
MVVAAILWVTAPITALAVMWAIYSNNQMEVMQKELWKLEYDNQKLKRQLNKKKAGDEALREQVNQEVERRLKDERNLFKTVG